MSKYCTLGLGVLFDGGLDGSGPVQQEFKLRLCEVHPALLKQTHQLALHGAFIVGKDGGQVLLQIVVYVGG